MGNNTNNERLPLHHVERGIIEHGPDGITHTPLPLPVSDVCDARMQLIVAALGGEGAFAELPVLDLEECGAFGGSTGYIDFVRPEDMTGPVMRGEDEHGRPFVSFLLSREVVDHGSANYPHDMVVKEFVETLFRRYTTGPVWVSGGGQSLAQGALDNQNVFDLVRRVAKGLGERVAWHVEDI